MKAIQTTILAAVLTLFGTATMAGDNNTEGVKKSVEKKNEQISKASKASSTSKAHKAKKAPSQGTEAADKMHDSN